MLSDTWSGEGGVFINNCESCTQPYKSLYFIQENAAFHEYVHFSLKDDKACSLFIIIAYLVSIFEKMEES